MAGPRSRATARSQPSSSTPSASPTKASRCSPSPRPNCISRPTGSKPAFRHQPKNSLVDCNCLNYNHSGQRRGRSFMTTKRGGNGRKIGLSEASPHYHGHRERLRGRFRDAGAEAVSDYELLELVLFRAIPQRDVKPLAKELIAKFGSFAEVIAAPPARLAEVKGMGEAVITELKLVQAAAGRLTRGEVKKRPVLSSWSSVLDYCRTTMAFAEKEQFRVMFLDKRNQ